MKSHKHIQEELQQLGSTLPVVPESPLTVPPGYFEGLAAAVLARVKEQNLSPAEELATLSPLLAQISKKQPFSLPPGYFSDLAADIPALTGAEVLPPLLAAAGRTMPNTVPEGYFQDLPGQVLSKVAKPEAKIIGIYRKRWMQLAAAAVITGIIAIGTLTYFGNQEPTNSVLAAWVEKGLKQVSDETLENFLASTDAVHQETVAKTATSPELRSLMNDVSVKEIDAFLDQVPTDDEELLIIN